MNHPIAQFVALTCHANAFLQGRVVPRFLPGNSTSTFCDSITFVELSKTLLRSVREHEVADTPDAWFAYLKAIDVPRIHVSCKRQNRPGISRWISAAFAGGGGNWAMEAVQRNGKRAVWVSRWEVWNQNAPERRIWRVRYGRASKGRWPAPALTDLEALASRFRAALADIHRFSERQRCAGFTDRFAQAIETLDSSGTKRHGYHRDLAPAGGLPPLAVWLLDACQSAWVFGGIGSWNDLAFQGEAQLEYERTSQRLFLVLSEVIQAAANASCSGGA